MAATVTLIKDSYDVWGKHTVQAADVVLGTYATGGVALSPASFGLKSFRGVQFIGGNAASAGYSLQWDTTNSKVVAYRSAGFTPAGTNGTSAVTGTAAAQTFTGSAASLTATSSKPTFSVESSGAIGTNMEVGLSADTAGATFEGGTGITAQRVLTTTSPVGTPTITPGAYTPAGTNAASASLSATAAAQTFTGTAVAAAAMVEVTNGVSLAAVTVRVLAIGL